MDAEAIASVEQEEAHRPCFERHNCTCCVPPSCRFLRHSHFRFVGQACRSTNSKCEEGIATHGSNRKLRRLRSALLRSQIFDMRVRGLCSNNALSSARIVTTNVTQPTGRTRYNCAIQNCLFSTRFITIQNLTDVKTNRATIPPYLDYIAHEKLANKRKHNDNGK